jgi:outer membrane protein OmpA-like peptidoglycan-associated protein
MRIFPLLLPVSMPGIDIGPDPPAPRVVREVSVYFIEGGAVLNEIDQAQLDSAARFLRDDVPTATASITGYATNAELAEQRARAVRDYLVAHHGLDPSRFQVATRVATVPLGEEHRRAVVAIELIC